MGYVRTYRRKDGTIVRGHYRRNKYSGSTPIRNYYSSDVVSEGCAFTKVPWKPPKKDSFFRRYV